MSYRYMSVLWVRFPCLPIEFFSKAILMKLSNLIGNASEVDCMTMDALREAIFPELGTKWTFHALYFPRLRWWDAKNMWNMKACTKYVLNVANMGLAEVCTITPSVPTFRHFFDSRPSSSSIHEPSHSPSRPWMVPKSYCC